MRNDNVPPAGPVEGNVDLHLTKSGGRFVIEISAIERDHNGQEITAESLGEVIIDADDSVPGHTHDIWFSYRQYLEDRDYSGYSTKLKAALEHAGELGLVLAECEP